ncbi:hypothetical protein SprV_0100417400 [Sparganum proliferum]
MLARVTDNGTVSEAFVATNKVKQDCVSVPTSFGFMCTAMLVDAYRDERPWLCIAYRTDDHLPSIRRIHTSTSLSTTTLRDLLFADD